VILGKRINLASFSSIVFSPQNWVRTAKISKIDPRKAYFLSRRLFFTFQINFNSSITDVYVFYVIVLIIEQNFLFNIEGLGENFVISSFEKWEYYLNIGKLLTCGATIYYVCKLLEFFIFIFLCYAP
jgi:hypothetical protein